MSTENIKVGGSAFNEMLSSIDVDSEVDRLRQDILATKSASAKDKKIKQLKYLAGLQKMGMKPDSAYMLHSMPVLPPVYRPVQVQGGNRLEFAEVNQLYKDHMILNNSLSKVKDLLPPELLVNERKGLYAGAKAVFGFGEAISGAARGRELKGLARQIGGTMGPKTGFFHDRILKKRQDFSGRGVISAEPNLGFNEVAMPEKQLYTLYKFHILKNLVKQGYSYPEAEKAYEEKTLASQNAFKQIIKDVPLYLNRPPTLMRSNVTALFPKVREGSTIGINILHLPMFAGD